MRTVKQDDKPLFISLTLNQQISNKKKKKSLSVYVIYMFNNMFCVLLFTLLCLDGGYNYFQSCQRPPVVLCLGL